MPLYADVPRLPKTSTGYYYSTSNASEVSLVSRSGLSVFWALRARFDSLRRQASATGLLARAWDTYDAEPPNDLSRRLADQWLSSLESEALAPDSLMASVEGGICLGFAKGSRRAAVELYNDGEMLVTTHGASAIPDAWTVASGTELEAIRKIRVHLSQSPS